ncbi:hypothetical protein CALCODRAFT_324795 [Calocera cornea HHB12733]|uniref:Uncharacterized protein n=1 Tax=Calocera cornea HHB12733 TaxID=1353952 RepID=A0A165F4I4_9BASI|nr:hypothetical protein CALCODRAFT_324795 [Calocera cornea HHB12733]
MVTQQVNHKSRISFRGAAVPPLVRGAGGACSLQGPSQLPVASAPRDFPPSLRILAEAYYYSLAPCPRQHKPLCAQRGGGPGGLRGAGPGTCPAGAYTVPRASPARLLPCTCYSLWARGTGGGCDMLVYDRDSLSLSGLCSVGIFYIVVHERADFPPPCARIRCLLRAGSLSDAYRIARSHPRRLDQSLRRCHRFSRTGTYRTCQRHQGLPLSTFVTCGTLACAYQWHRRHDIINDVLPERGAAAPLARDDLALAEAGMRRYRNKGHD